MAYADMVRGMTPETLRQLAALGVIPGQIEDAQADKSLARDMRFMAAPEGRQAGGAYLAANPMEHIGTVMQRIAGQRDERQQQALIEALRNQQTQGRTGAMQGIQDSLRGRSMRPGGAPGYAVPSGRRST